MRVRPESRLVAHLDAPLDHCPHRPDGLLCDLPGVVELRNQGDGLFWAYLASSSRNAWSP